MKEKEKANKKFDTTIHWGYMLVATALYGLVILVTAAIAKFIGLSDLVSLSALIFTTLFSIIIISSNAWFDSIIMPIERIISRRSI